MTDSFQQAAPMSAMSPSTCFIMAKCSRSENREIFWYIFRKCTFNKRCFEKKQNNRLWEGSVSLPRSKFSIWERYLSRQQRKLSFQTPILGNDSVFEDGPEIRTVHPDSFPVQGGPRQKAAGGQTAGFELWIARFIIICFGPGKSVLSSQGIRSTQCPEAMAEVRS